MFYLEADQSDSVVIMDKHDYDQKVMNKLTTGNFKELRHDTLPETIKNVEKVLKECKLLIGDNIANLRMPNPCLPRIKYLPKIQLTYQHKS